MNFEKVILCNITRIEKKKQKRKADNNGFNDKSKSHRKEIIKLRINK